MRTGADGATPRVTPIGHTSGFLGGKGPTLSTTNPATNNPKGAPGDPIPAVYRRLMRALGDLGIAPQPVGDEPQRWATLDVCDGETVISFGSLSLDTAARLANLLEDLVPGASSSAASADDGPHDPDGAGEYVMAPFEPVASPLEPYRSVSRQHPRTAW